VRAKAREQYVRMLGSRGQQTHSSV
jgi:hypothetical protein